MARGGVSFELERFGWTGEGSGLEVAGRWRGTRPRRFGPAALAVEVDGRRHRPPTLLTGEVRADPEPALWRAEYGWDGGEVGRFELEVGSNLIIELPPPEGSPPPAGRSIRTGTDPRRAELEAAQRQMEADRVEQERLRNELVTLRRDALELDQTREFLRLAQATAEAERKAVRAAREAAAARRSADSGGPSRTAAELKQEETAALKLELDRARERAGVALQEADRVRDELLRERASAGAARDEFDRLEQALRAEARDATEEAHTLREALAAGAADASAPPDAPTEAFAAAGPAVDPKPPGHPPEPIATGPPRSSPEPSRTDLPPDGGDDPADDTLVLQGPRRRPAVHQFRPRVIVVPQRTAPAPRRYAERPPKDSPALRAIAGVLLLLLVIVLVTVLVIVA